MNQLQEIQTQIAACEAELQQIVQQIEDIYLEGPIVDGWLESYAEEETGESPRTGYRLRGLDASGKMWSHLCPLEQLPSVSIAIARYQKLRQLLGRKRNVERRLSQSQQIVAQHDQLKASEAVGDNHLT